MIMFISDIRMKSRGVSLPKSQSPASGFVQHTIQHSGITRTMTFLSSLIFMFHIMFWNVCLWKKRHSVCVSFLGSSNHSPNSSTEEVTRGVAVEKLDSVRKWGINTYKVWHTFSILYHERFTSFLGIKRWTVNLLKKKSVTICWNKKKS